MKLDRSVLLLAAAAAAAVSSLVVVAARSQADEPRAHTTATLFVIRKSENRNRVEYTMRLDPACRPVGAAPVRASWRLLERGPNVRESLEVVERPAYGIARQRVSTVSTGFQVALVLRALPARTIEVTSEPAAGHCRVVASTQIGGSPSTIDDILVVLRGPLSIDHLELRGRALGDGAARFERIER